MYDLLCFTDCCVSGYAGYKYLSEQSTLMINKSKLDNISHVVG